MMSELYQVSVFDILSDPFKIDKPVRLIELFAGIGSQAKALERLGVSVDYISMILNGKKTPKDAEKRIMSALNEIIASKSVT